jgi:PAS domain S-box-containing protein
MSPLKILHLEDSRPDAELVAATLASGGLAADIVRVDRRETFQAALESGDFDLILADYNLPAFDGVTAQELATRSQPDTPFIFLSGSIGEDLAVERLREGATDYVLKDRMARLPSAVRRALDEAAERADRRRAEEEVRRLNAELEQRVADRTAALAHANEALAESERRLQAILNHSPAVSLKDLSGRYILANREFERMAAVPHGDILGKTDRELFPPRLADAYRANDDQVLSKNRGMELEETFLQADGVHVYHTIRFPLRDGDGRTYALCAIFIDISERKKTDDALKIARLEAERANRAKSDFLSRMSHDLRTPLNAILGFAQILELASLGPEERESVTQILKGGQHLLQLINEVLDIARIEAGHLSLSVEPVNAGEIVQQAIELVRALAGARGIAIDVHLPSQEVVIRADRQRLNQVLLNLLSNAVKYNRPGGSVTAGVEPLDDGRVRIAVTDTGPGIPPAKLALLFQPFERLGAEQSGIEGTGLGLALSRRLAEAMEGTLGVASEVDRGSTFWIELADCEAVQPRAAATRDVRGADAHSLPETAGVVLYIEDNHSNVRLMQRVLQRRPGVQLRHAATGADGVRMARGEQPGLIFLDLHLPDMSGEEVLEQLWQDPELRRIPVAILSADATPAHPSRLKASGAIAYLTKPLEIREVIDLIDDRLRVPVKR